MGSAYPDGNAVPADAARVAQGVSGKHSKTETLASPHRPGSPALPVHRRVRHSDGAGSGEVSGTMQAEGQADLIVKITASERGNPSGKLADVELHFGGGSLLAGLKLIGFSIWQGRAGRGPNVLFPARHYAIKSERRCFALLRPIVDSTAQDRIRDRILEAYAEYEQRAAADNTQRSPTE